MKKKPPFRKGIAFAVILLFISVAFAPSITADVNKTSDDIELVEITTEVYGVDGEKPHTVSLSKEDAVEVEQLFDDIQSRLDNVETREETIEIFNEAVVELDKYGLLGGLSVKQAQRLVRGKHHNSLSLKFLEWLFLRDTNIPDFEGIDNSFCLTVGHASPAWHITLWATILRWIVNRTGIVIPDFILYPLVYIAILCNIIPFYLLTTIIIGYSPNNPWGWFLAGGWIFTCGLNGTQSVNGEFRGIGDLPEGIYGFTGIGITIPEHHPQSFFLGHALKVKIKQY